MFAALAVGLCSFVAGIVAERRWPRAPVVAVAVVAAVPWALFVAYYFHVVDDIAYLEWRSHPFTDLLAGLIGIPVGVVRSVSGGPARRTQRLGAAGTVAALLVVGGLWVVAFAKPLLLPIPASLIEERQKDGVCLQSTSSTCGPCAASTVLLELGDHVGEGALAREASSTKTGTLNWLLVRALRERGYGARFIAPDRVTDVKAPAIVGVSLGSTGHFIAWFGAEGDDVEIGEPLQGRQRMSLTEFERRYTFDHFAIEVSKAR